MQVDTTRPSDSESRKVSFSSKVDCPAFLKKINKFVKNHFADFALVGAAAVTCYLAPIPFIACFIGGALIQFCSQKFFLDKLPPSERYKLTKLAKDQEKYLYAQVVIYAILAYNNYFVRGFGAGVGFLTGMLAYRKFTEYRNHS